MLSDRELLEGAIVAFGRIEARLLAMPTTADLTAAVAPIITGVNNLLAQSATVLNAVTTTGADIQTAQADLQAEIAGLTAGDVIPQSTIDALTGVGTALTQASGNLTTIGTDVAAADALAQSVIAAAAVVSPPAAAAPAAGASPALADPSPAAADTSGAPPPGATTPSAT